MKKIMIAVTVIFLLFLSNTAMAACVPGDAGVPTRITSLFAEAKSDNKIRISWTAPYDLSGCVLYEVRYRENTGVTTTTWASSVKVATGVPLPESSGTGQSMDVTIPKAATKYYLGIKTKDGCGKWSVVSNSPYAITLATGKVKVPLAWDAVTENGDGSPCTDLGGYRVKYGFESRVYEDNEQDVGNVTTSTLILSKYVEYYIAVIAYDTDDNESGYSNEIIYPPIP